MKRFATFMLILVLAVSAFGCNKTDGELPEASPAPAESSSESAPESVAETVPETTERILHLIPASWGDYIKLNGLTYIGDWLVSEVPSDMIGERVGIVRSGPPEVYCDDEGNIYNDTPADGSAGWLNIGT